MKRTFLLSPALFLFATTIVSAQVTVSGAGDASMNGTYTSCGSNDGKTKYCDGSNVIIWLTGQWIIGVDNIGISTRYNNLNDTPMPPNRDWQPDGGAAPAPILSGDVTALPGLVGTYTVGGASPDYATLQDAANALGAEEVVGPVTFEIRPGTYNDKVTFGAINRTGDPMDPVTFRPESGTVTWQTMAASTGSNYVVRMSGADYMVFEDIDFNAASASPHGRLISFTGGSRNNTFRSCTFTGLLDPPDDEGSLVYSSSTTNQFNVFENNTFTLGFRGIDMEGIDNDNRSNGTVIAGNTFGGQAEGGIRIRFQEEALIEDNEVNDAAWSNATYVGIFADGQGTEILRNGIDMQGGDKGIQLQSGSGIDRLIANNLIGSRGGSADAGIVLTVGNVNVYHNTVRTLNTGDKATFRTNSGISGIHLKNNLFINAGGGLALDVPTPTSIASSDYNNLYTVGNFPARWDGIVYGSLESFSTVSGTDLNSVSKSVDFVDVVGAPDLHLSGTSDGDPDLVGTPLALVPQDFDEESRDEFNPYMGADEASNTLSPLDNADVGGFYTVGGVTPHFSDPEEAIDHLNKRGIKGETTFRIRAGTYEVNAVIEDFDRHVSTEAGTKLGGFDIVLFRAANASNPPTLRYAAITPDDNYVIKIDGADQVHFENLNLTADGAGQWARVLVLENSVDNLVVQTCTLTSTNSNDGIFNAIVYSSGSDNNYASFTGNTFEEGSYGIYFVSTDLARSNGVSLDGNSFLDQFWRGVWFEYQDEISITDNLVVNPENNFRGFELRDGELFSITKNRMYLTGSASRGIQTSDLDGTPIESGLIANNVITAVDIALYFIGSYVDVLHNTLRATESPASESSALKFSTSISDSRVLNNILYHDNGGYALDRSGSSPPDLSDYNDLYNGFGNPLVRISGTEYGDLVTYQTAENMDLNSVTKAVTFVNPGNGNLHLTGPSDGDTDLAGTPVIEVTTDIDDEVRSNVAPYMGADEATLLAVGFAVDVTALLAGPYDDGNPGMMTTGLNSGGYLESNALNHPYNGAPWNYAGTESVAPGFFAAHPTIVDWVYLQLRGGDPNSPPMTIESEAVGFLLNDGSIVSHTDGISPVLFEASAGSYSVAVFHRSHLGVLSSTPVVLSVSAAKAQGTVSYDFTDSQTKAFGTEPMMDLGNGHFGLWAGDANSDGQVVYIGGTRDQVEIINILGTSNLADIATGYYGADMNLDGQVVYIGGTRDQVEIINTLGTSNLAGIKATEVPTAN